MSVRDAAPESRYDDYYSSGRFYQYRPPQYQWVPAWTSWTMAQYKLFFIQLFAMGALVAVFAADHLMNPDFIDGAATFVPFVGDMGVAGGVVLGCLMGFGLCLFSLMPEGPKRWGVWIALAVFLLMFFGGPLAEYLAGSPDEAIYAALYGSSMALLKAMTVFVVLAPMVLGIYGIWRKEPLYAGIAGVFLLAIVVILASYRLVTTGTVLPVRYDAMAEMASFLLFSIAFFAFLELSDAVGNIQAMILSHPEYLQPGFYQDQLNSIMSRYARFFALFVIAATILVLIAIDFVGLVRAWSPEMYSRSLELTSIFGLVIAVVVLALVLVIVGTLFKMKDSFVSAFRRAWAWAYDFMHPVPDAYRRDRAMHDDEYGNAGRGDSYARRTRGRTAARVRATDADDGAE